MLKPLRATAFVLLALAVALVAAAPPSVIVMPLTGAPGGATPYCHRMREDA